MLNIGPQEMLVILLVALVVVGPQRLPEMGRTIGKALRELRRAQDEVRRVGLLVCTSDRGLAGAYNANVLREAARLRRLLDDRRGTVFVGYSSLLLLLAIAAVMLLSDGGGFAPR